MQMALWSIKKPCASCSPWQLIENVLVLETNWRKGRKNYVKLKSPRCRIGRALILVFRHKEDVAFSLYFQGVQVQHRKQKNMPCIFYPTYYSERGCMMLHTPTARTDQQVRLGRLPLGHIRQYSGQYNSPLTPIPKGVWLSEWSYITTFAGRGGGSFSFNCILCKAYFSVQISQQLACVFFYYISYGLPDAINIRSAVRFFLIHFSVTISIHAHNPRLGDGRELNRHLSWLFGSQVTLVKENS